MKPIFYPHLVTSTPDSYKISKRIKRLSAYSEHYKGSRVDYYPNVGPNFSPLRIKDYRKARELTLEIWDPMIQASFFEKFLKSQKNLHTIRINILTKREYNGKILKRLCGILSKNSGLNRISIDFDEDQRRKVKQELLNGIISLRTLPKLKDLEVTVAGEQIIPFSIGLAKVGFETENGSFGVKDTSTVLKLTQKASKFHQLSTIRIASNSYSTYPDEFVDALVLVISKLPNFLELDFNNSKDLHLPVKKTLNILDTLAKAPKFETLRLGLQMKGISSQISILKHPLFKAKSLKRTSLSFFFYEETAPEDLDEVFDLLEGMSSLYELYLDFSNYTGMSDGAVEVLAKKFGKITSLRKLKIRFSEYQRKFGAKQAGDMIRSIFNMNFLEELDLALPKNCLALGENNDIQGLPRLKKASVRMDRWGNAKENEIRGVVEILGKCFRLRELVLFLTDSVRDCEKMAKKLCESLRKLKELQVFKVYATAEWRYSQMTQELMWEFLMTWNRMRNLQDLTVFMGMDPHERSLNYGGLYNQLAKNKKYRCFVLGR